MIEKRDRRRQDGGEDAVYRVRFRDERGRERSRTFDRIADARAHEGKMRVAKRAGMLADLDAGTETLAEFVEEWWTIYAGAEPRARDAAALPRYVERARAAAARQRPAARHQAAARRASITLLARRGYQATTFDAICAHAGLSSKRLITYHFSSKEALWGAITEQVVADAEASMRPALDAASGARELLAAAIRANVRYMVDHPDEMLALQQIILNGASAWNRHHEESITRLANLFAEGQRSGAFRHFDTQVMATALRGALDAMLTRLSAGVDANGCAEELVELFDRATRHAEHDDR